MSVSTHPRPAHPFLRQLACSVIGLGCLLTAGTVLSSVVKAPVHPPAQSRINYAARSWAVYGLPTTTKQVARLCPLEALVSVQNGSLRVMNDSHYPWRNVRVQAGVTSSQESRSHAYALVMPYETCAVSLETIAGSRSSSHSVRRPISLRWDCRTEAGDEHWCGYLAQ